ncbi:MAG: hypothetical protein ACFFB0_09435 [Promethearchaeota archaeon]
MNQNEEKIFVCNLDDTNLFNCILNEVGEKDLDIISQDLPVKHDETIINCVSASLVVCLRNLKDKLETLEVQVKLSKYENGNWIINHINVIVSEDVSDDLINSRINQCLKFIKRGCATDESINFSIIKSESKENLNNYEIKLLELNKWLDNLRDDKKKKERLFTLFKNIKSD